MKVLLELPMYVPMEVPMRLFVEVSKYLAPLHWACFPNFRNEQAATRHTHHQPALRESQTGSSHNMAVCM